MTTLCNIQITAAQTGVVQTAVTGLGTPTSVTLEAIFTYVASAATTVDAWVQTSIDAGVTWYDVANFHYTTASAVQYQNVSNTAINTSTALTSLTLSSSTSINGFLGDRLRVVDTTVGTYGAGTQLTINAYPRY